MWATFSYFLSFSPKEIFGFMPRNLLVLAELIFVSFLFFRFLNWTDEIRFSGIVSRAFLSIGFVSLRTAFRVSLFSTSNLLVNCFSSSVETVFVPFLIYFSSICSARFRSRCDTFPYACGCRKTFDKSRSCLKRGVIGWVRPQAILFVLCIEF